MRLPYYYYYIPIYLYVCVFCLHHFSTFMYRLTVLKTTKCEIIVQSPVFYSNERRRGRKNINYTPFTFLLNSMTHMV